MALTQTAGQGPIVAMVSVLFDAADKAKQKLDTALEDSSVDAKARAFGDFWATLRVPKGLLEAGQLNQAEAERYRRLSEHLDEVSSRLVREGWTAEVGVDEKGEETFSLTPPAAS